MDDQVVTPFRIMLPVAVLKAHPDEAEIILRAGAAANALLTLGRTVLRHEPAKPTATDRQDHIQVVFMAAGYVYEFNRTVSKAHAGLGWDLIERGKHERALPLGWTVETVKAFLSDPLTVRVIATIRDKCAFHWDPEPFRDFMKPLPEHLPLELQRVEASEVSSLVFTASYSALVTLFKPEEFEPIVDRISELIVVVPYLVEAMLVGFALKQGIDLSKNVYTL